MGAPHALGTRGTARFEKQRHTPYAALVSELDEDELEELPLDDSLDELDELELDSVDELDAADELDELLLAPLEP